MKTWVINLDPENYRKQHSKLSKKNETWRIYGYQRPPKRRYLCSYRNISIKI